MLSPRQAVTYLQPEDLRGLDLSKLMGEVKLTNLFFLPFGFFSS